MFGNTSFTPKTQATSLFGATSTPTTAANNSLFGFGTPQPASQAPAQASPFSFGKQAPSGGLFGAPTAAGAAPTTNLFGAAPAATTAPTANLFGGSTTKTAPATNMFGSAPATTIAPATNLFGAASSAAPTTNLFGAAPAATTAPTANLFGAPATTPASNLFGAASSTAPTTNLFGGTSSAAPATSLFTAKPAPTAQPTLGLKPAASTGPGLSLGQTPALSFGQAPAATTSAPTLNFGGVTPAATAAPAPALKFGLPSATTATTSAPTLSLGAAPAATQPVLSLAAPAATAAPAPALKFGFTTTTSGPTLTLGAAPAATQPALSLAAPAATAAPAQGLKFGFTSTTTTATSAPTLTLSAAPAATQPGLGLAASPAAAKPADPAQSLAGKIKFSELDQMINRFAIDLQEQDNRFQDLLAYVNKQDMIVYERQQKLDDIVKETDALEKDHFRFVTQVEMLEEQQAEARRAIEEMEKALGLPAFNDPHQPGPASNLNVDVRRAAILQLLLETDIAAKQLENEVDDATQQLNSVRNLKDRLQQTNEPDGNNHSEQLQSILNCQMQAIMKLESECDVISKKLATVRAKNV